MFASLNGSLMAGLEIIAGCFASLLNVMVISGSAYFMLELAGLIVAQHFVLSLSGEPFSKCHFSFSSKL